MSSDKENKSFVINGWRVDPQLNRLSRADEIIRIDPQNMKVLELLASRPGDVISQSEIEQLAWPGVIVTPNSVYQSIAQLRKALGDDKTRPQYIETIAKKGYRLIAKVGPLEPAAAPTSDRPSGIARYVPLRFVLLASFASVLLVPIVVAHVRRTTEPVTVPVPNPARLTGTVHYATDAESAAARADRLLGMGDVALRAGRPREALRYFEGALRALDEFIKETSPVRAEYLAKIAAAHLWNDNPREAADIAREGLRILEKSAPKLHPTFIDLRRSLGEALIDEENYREAEVQLVASLALSRALYGELDVDTIETKDSLVCLYMAQQNWAAAAELAREVLRQLSARHSNDIDAAIYRIRYARILYASTEYDQAFEEVGIALQILGGITRPDHQLVGSAKQVMADVLVQMGDYRKGELLARESFEIWKNNDSEPWRSARAASTLGESLLRQGKLAEAEQYLGYAARILEGQTGYMQKDARSENDRRIAELDAAKRSASSG